MDLDNIETLELSSGVFRSLCTHNPICIIWKKGKALNITDNYEYYYALRNNPNEVKKIYETREPYEIVDIYEATAYSYVNSVDERLAKLLDIIDAVKLTKNNHKSIIN